MTDPSGVASVAISWSVGAVSGSAPMILLDTTAGAVIGPFDWGTVPYSQTAEVAITITARDTLGNVSEKPAPTSITLHSCDIFG